MSACHAGFLVTKAQLKRAKNDVLDAEILAELAQALVPERWRPSPHIYYELQQRLAQRSSFLWTIPHCFPRAKKAKTSPRRGCNRSTRSTARGVAVGVETHALCQYVQLCAGSSGLSTGECCPGGLVRAQGGRKPTRKSHSLFHLIRLTNAAEGELREHWSRC